MVRTTPRVCTANSKERQANRRVPPRIPSLIGAREGRRRKNFFTTVSSDSSEHRPTFTRLACVHSPHYYFSRSPRSQVLSTNNFIMSPRSQSLFDGYVSADAMYGGNATDMASAGPGLINSTVLSKADADCNEIESLLSKYSTADATSGHMPDADIQTFYAVFERQANGVLQFVDHHEKGLEFSAKSLLTQTEKMMDQVTLTEHDGQSMIMASKRATEEIVETCLALQAFLTKNRASLLAVSRKADTKLSTQCTKMIESSVKANLNSVLVVVLSDVYATIRTAETKLKTNGAGNEAAVWEAPSSFQRTTTKYWVKEEELTKLMLTCAAEAPLLVYGKSGTLTQNRSSGYSEGDKLWESMTTPITSVYFDAPDMSMYKKRLARLEGAQLLRARWYGQKMPQGSGVIFLELKTHHEQWVVNKSVKERAAIQEKDMPSFLKPIAWSPNEAREIILRASPKLSPDELTKSTNLLFRMHQLVIKYKLRSCVRSVYARAAFQSAKSNDLRLTLDRNVTLVDETRRITTDASSWCLSDDEAVTSAKAVTVPFNVFEVKLVGDSPMPAGLAGLISLGVIEEAPKFSKFLSGAAAFNRVSTLPYWAKHPAFATMFGMQSKFKDPRAYTPSIDPCDCYQLFDIFGGSSDDAALGSSSGTTRKRNPLVRFLNPTAVPAGTATMTEDINRENVKIAEKKPVRVEPKSFFANERTYIQWVSASLLLLTVSSILMGSGDYSGSAALISSSAFFLVIYATFVYFRRIKLLSSGKGQGYIDHFGPTILALGVGSGIFIVLCDLFVGHDVLDFSINGRRLNAIGNRKLMSLASSPQISSMYESPGHCFRQPIAGINALTFKPNDATVDNERSSLLVASTTEILSHPFQGGEISHLLHLESIELGGLTNVGDRVFAISGGPAATELFEYAWTPMGALEQQASWIVWNSATEINGLTFVPNDGDDEHGQLYVGFDGSIHIYNLPGRGDPSLVRAESLNMKMIGQGLGTQGKITSAHHHEGLTYLLHSQHNALHAWDMITGEFLGEIPLPRLHKPLSDEWQGFAFERRPIPNGGKSLRTKKASSEIFLHLTTSAPPQVWSFAIKEDDGNRGHFLFPDCAAAATNTEQIN